MVKIFFATRGVAFSELRQIAVTVCHGFVSYVPKQKLSPDVVIYP